MSPLRPGREHDTTCARAHGLVDALNRLAATVGVPTLTDLGSENIGDGFRHPPELGADAVALYRSRQGATIKSVAVDPGGNTETLRNWIRAAAGRRPGSQSGAQTAASALEADMTVLPT